MLTTLFIHVKGILTESQCWC